MQAKFAEKPDNFGTRLRWFRVQRNCTQADLGKAVNRTASSISEWEKGESEPSLEQIIILAEVLGTSPGRLAFGPIEETISRIEEDLLNEFRGILGLANGDPGRIGWIREQLRAHLSPPPHWLEMDPKKAAEKVIAEAERSAAKSNPREHAGVREEWLKAHQAARIAPEKSARKVEQADAG